MARGAIKCVSINGALTVTFTAASGATPTVFSDEACTSTTSLPATIADGANATFYFASPGSYTLSVKTASGIQIAGDLNTTKVVTVSAGDVGVYAYDTRLVSRDASGDSGRHSPGTDLGATYEAPTLPEAFGAIGDGATDDTAALAAWAASGKTTLALQPNKTYLTTATVVLPVAAQFDGRGSTIKASGVIAGPILRTSAAQSREGVTRNVILACDNKAQTGFTAYWVAQHTLADLTVYDATSHAVILGDPTPGTSYGVGVYNLTVDRPSRTAAPAGSFALWCRNSSDNIVVLATLIGSETGVRNDTGDNLFVGVHVWGYSTSVPITCFDDNATGGQYDGCIADTPTTQGWLLRTTGGGNVMIRGGKTYVNNVYGVDNTVTGVKVNDVGSVFFSVIGHHFQGADGTHRLLRDVSVTDGNNPMYLGNQYTNVANSLNPANRVSSAFQVNGQSTFNGTPNAFGNVQIFAGAGSTRYTTYSTGGSVAGASARWQSGANATAEGGSNAGSDWDLVSRTDAGAFLATVMHAIRANGVVQFDAGSIAVHVKGGTPSDADYAVAPPNGTFVADSTGSKLWVRLGGAWKSVAVA